MSMMRLLLRLKYYNNCYNSFMTPTRVSEIGRPEKDSVTLAKEVIFE